MKHFYLFLFVCFFVINNSQAEPCPEAGTTSNSGTQIIFSYAENPSFCANAPSSIEVNGTTTFTMASCNNNVALYTKSNGPAVPGQGFTVTSGFDEACTYSEGTLPIEEFVLKTSLEIYPNPLRNANEVNVLFGLPITGKVELYSITGKLQFKSYFSDTMKTELDLSGVNNGVYMLKISSGGVLTNRKLVVIK